MQCQTFSTVGYLFLLYNHKKYYVGVVEMIELSLGDTAKFIIRNNTKMFCRLAVQILRPN